VEKLHLPSLSRSNYSSTTFALLSRFSHGRAGGKEGGKGKGAVPKRMKGVQDLVYPYGLITFKRGIYSHIYLHG
jgi:hypothetical protein